MGVGQHKVKQRASVSARGKKVFWRLRAHRGVGSSSVQLFVLSKEDGWRAGGDRRRKHPVYKGVRTQTEVSTRTRLGRSQSGW